MLINNKIYSLNYDVSDEIIYIYIRTFMIKPQYRNRGFSKKIFDNIRRKYKLPIILEYWSTLLEYYKHLGFVEIDRTCDGYIEMKLK